MPLTDIQKQIAILLAQTKSETAYLAGGAALHKLPNSIRYSNDLDYFCDSEKRVAECFAADKDLLERNNFSVHCEMTLPGYIRAIATKNEDASKIEWSRDTSWRFMPTQKDDDIGYCMHPVDLAINKLLANVGREEPRDFLDLIHAHQTILPLGALCWAAAGKDPGFTPFNLLELLKRRGQYHQTDFNRLLLNQPINLITLKQTWLDAIQSASHFIHSRPTSEIGCLYWAPSQEAFIAPNKEDIVVPHYGRPGGVLPQIMGTP